VLVGTVNSASYFLTYLISKYYQVINGRSFCIADFSLIQLNLKFVLLTYYNISRILCFYVFVKDLNFGFRMNQTPINTYMYVITN
jgi:hypothetical protein